MTYIIKNKQAFYEYTLIEKFIAGIELKGCEVKSIRAGKLSIAESYCLVENGEIFIKGMHVAEYMNTNSHTKLDPIRQRKLLLNKKEISKISKSLDQKGLTLIPLNVMLTKHGFIKLEISLAKGKKTYDKKAATKLRDMDRELNRSNIK